MSYKIEAGKAVPPERRKGPPLPKFPFDEMKVGDSFLVENDLAPACGSAAYWHGRKVYTKSGGKKEFRIRRQRESKTHTRVWRVA